MSDDSSEWDTDEKEKRWSLSKRTPELDNNSETSTKTSSSDSDLDDKQL